jgi:arylsulfatase A-like enzyme
MKSTFSLLIVSTLMTCLPAFSADTRPNVVIMLIDNHSYFELSCHGHPVLQTPRIDRLAQQGVSFTDFNAPPFCSPSRAELLTGRYALRAGIYNTVGGVSILHRNERTLADFMKEEGYRTAVFGKWHLGNTYPYAPRFRGFDEVFIHGGGGVSQLQDYYGNTHMDATYEHNGQYVKARGFSTDVLFDQGIDFIGRNRENPFFCLIATPAVHFPVLSHPENRKRLEARGVDDQRNLPIYSMIENVDDNVGRLLDFLKETGLKDNTLVVLASDQGVNDRGAITHRAGEALNRGVQYDEKHQVYCMIQYPELTDSNPGSCARLTGMVDITPTVLDLCGIDPPANLDGQSLKALLAGSGHWDGDRKLIIQCPRKRERIKWDNVSVKCQAWRLVDGKELYHVKNDRGQKINVINKHPDLTGALRAAYESFWRSLPSAEALISPHILGAAPATPTRLDGMDWYLGDQPWTQQGLRNKTSQGAWRIEIANKGRYRFELRRYPREAPRPIEAMRAMLEIGNAKAEVAIAPDATQAIIEMELGKGQYDMKTSFCPANDSTGKRDWGAYYVYVDYAGKGK